MARTLGSKNKATVAKQQAQVSTALDVDKHGNITRGGASIGTLKFEDGFFVARVGQSRFAAWFLEDALDLVKEAGV